MIASLPAELQVLRVLEADIELPLQLFGELVAAHGDGPGEDGEPAHYDAYACDGRPDVDHRDVLARGHGVVYLHHVLEGERVDVYDDRVEPGLFNDIGVVVDDIFFNGDQHDIHLAPAVGVRAQYLYVYVDIGYRERDVLLGLPLDGVGQLVLGHRREADLLYDDGMAGEG